MKIGTAPTAAFSRYVCSVVAPPECGKRPGEISSYVYRLHRISFISISDFVASSPGDLDLSSRRAAVSYRAHLSCHLHYRTVE